MDEKRLVDWLLFAKSHSTVQDDLRELDDLIFQLQDGYTAKKLVLYCPHCKKHFVYDGVYEDICTNDYISVLQERNKALQEKADLYRDQFENQAIHLRRENAVLQAKLEQWKRQMNTMQE